VVFTNLPANERRRGFDFGSSSRQRTQSSCATSSETPSDPTFTRPALTWQPKRIHDPLPFTHTKLRWALRWDSTCRKNTDPGHGLTSCTRHARRAAFIWSCGYPARARRSLQTVVPKVQVRPARCQTFESDLLCCLRNLVRLVCRHLSSPLATTAGTTRCWAVLGILVPYGHACRVMFR